MRQYRMVAVRFQSFEDFIKETFRIFNKPLRFFKRSIEHYGNQDLLTFLWDEGWFARLHSLDDGNCLIFTQCAGPLFLVRGGHCCCAGVPNVRKKGLSGADGGGRVVIKLTHLLMLSALMS